MSRLQSGPVVIEKLVDGRSSNELARNVVALNSAYPHPLCRVDAGRRAMRMGVQRECSRANLELYSIAGNEQGVNHRLKITSAICVMLIPFIEKHYFGELAPLFTERDRRRAHLPTCNLS